MSKPVMIAGGCSFTAPNYDCKKHDAWPQVLADTIKRNHGIDYEVINTARKGSSLSKSIDRIQRAIFPPKGGPKPHPENLIVLGGTEWWREYSTWTEHDYIPSYLMLHMINHAIKKGEHKPVELPHWIVNPEKDSEPRAVMEKVEAMGIKPFLTEWLTKFYTNTEYKKRRIHYAFQQIYNLINMAKALGFKVLIYQLLDPLPSHDHYLENWMNIPVKEDIEPWIIRHLDEVFLYNVLKKEKSIIGFPFFDFLGGSNYEKNIWNEKHNMDLEDTHPNALGHKAIAKEFYKGWKNL